MKRVPLLVLFAGVVAAGYGGVLLWVSAYVEGLVWLASAIAAGGLFLIALWLRWSRRDADAEQE